MTYFDKTSALLILSPEYCDIPLSLGLDKLLILSLLILLPLILSVILGKESTLDILG